MGDSNGSCHDVEVRVDDGIMSICLARPQKLNALTYDMIRALRMMLRSAADDSEVRCVLLQGAGRAFCAGDDLAGMGDLPEGLDPVEKSCAHGYLTLLRALRELPKPVVVGVQGFCLGAGFDVALACDVRVVSRDATLGTRYIRIGLASGAYLLPRIVGVSRAVDLLFTGRDVSGEEADRWGLVTQLVEPDDVGEASWTWARQLRDMPTRSIGYVKRLVYAASEMTLDQGFREAAFTSALAHATEDYEEAKQAWREKREPVFRGR